MILFATGNALNLSVQNPSVSLSVKTLAVSLKLKNVASAIKELLDNFSFFSKKANLTRVVAAAKID
jgi:hypothetical protein